MVANFAASAKPQPGRHRLPSNRRCSAPRSTRRSQPQAQGRGRENDAFSLDPTSSAAGHTPDMLKGIDPAMPPYTQICDTAGDTPGQPYCVPGHGIVPLKEIMDTLPQGIPLSLEWGPAAASRARPPIGPDMALPSPATGWRSTMRRETHEAKRPFSLRRAGHQRIPCAVAGASAQGRRPRLSPPWSCRTTSATSWRRSLPSSRQRQ